MRCGWQPWARTVESFVIRENIERFRRMLEQTSDENARRQIMQLLKEEEAKLGRIGEGGFSGERHR
jgi:hypothetical protein